MKAAVDIKPNYAPVYAAALYPELAKIFQKHGYALAAHGSLAKDFDLIAIPWIKGKLGSHKKILKEITTTFAIRLVGKSEKKNWGRVAYTVSIGHGECRLDLSFFPNIK